MGTRGPTPANYDRKLNLVGASAQPGPAAPSRDRGDADISNEHHRTRRRTARSGARVQLFWEDDIDA